MTEPAWAPRALPTPAPRPRSRRRGSLLPILGCLPIALGAMLWLLKLPTEVRSEAELGSVGFGWPIAWLTQDQSRYAPQQFPMAAEYVGAKGMTDPLPTHVDWAVFTFDTAVLWGVACAVMLLAIRLLRGAHAGRVRRGATASR